MVLKRNINLIELLVNIITFTTILFGPGRMIMIGPVTGRYLLMGILLVSLLLKHNRGIPKTNSNVILFIMLFYFVVEALVGCMLYNYSSAISESGGYICIVMCIFFISYFKDDANRVIKWMLFFRKCVLLLAVIQIAIYMYCVINGESVYPLVNGFLKNYAIGFVDFFGSGFAVRVFLKGAITFIAGLMIEIACFMKSGINIKSVLRTIILLLALVVTFSSAFLLFSFVLLIAFITLNLDRKNRRRILLGSFFFIVIVVIVVSKTNFFGILMSRYNNTYDAIGYRMSQIVGGFNSWINSPLFGTGFGKPIFINNNGITRYTSVFEVMWVQILVHTGLVGTGLFIFHILQTLAMLLNKRKETNQMLFGWAMIWIIYMCFVSFINPYMNGCIGLFFYSVLTGMAHIDSKKINELFV